jgi:ribokinase
MGRVFVLGSINQDYLVYADRRPRAGETVTGVTVVTRHGGKGANQAVAAVDSGAAVMLLARIGDDVAGSAQRDDLAARGVDVSLVAATSNVSTGTAFVTVTPDGENSVLVAPGANGLVEPGDVRAAARFIADHSVLVAQLEVPLDTVVEAVNLCGANTHVLLNAAPFAPLPGALLERIGTLVVNKVEAAAMVDAAIVGIAGALESATLLTGHGVRAAVVTLGADGAVVATGDRCTHVPAPRVSVVDTTGAGDVFVGTLAALLAEDQPLDRAVGIAVERASASVASIGARAPTPVGTRDIGETSSACER